MYSIGKWHLHNTVEKMFYDQNNKKKKKSCTSCSYNIFMIHWLVTDLSDLSRQRQEVSVSQEPDLALVLNLTWITDSILRQNQYVN